MRSISRTVLALALSVVAIGISVAQDKEAHPAHEQTTFAEDEPLRHPVRLSTDVLKVLLSTNEAKNALANASDSQQKNAAHLFQGTKVHLNGPDEIDLVVIGIPPMAGADNGWFWVVRSANKNPQVVLFVGGNTLELMDSRTLGYRDINTIWASPSVTKEMIYHFDESRYKLWKQKSTPTPNSP
jgi:hypothetical protein